MRRGKAFENRRDQANGGFNQVAPALLGVVVVCGTLLIGGVNTTTVCGLAAVSGVAMLLLGASQPRRFSLGTWVFVALSVVTLLQSVPMPTGIVATVSPVLAETWQRAHELRAVEGYSFLSFDPAATRVESLKLLLYAAGWAGAFHHARRHGLRDAARLVFGLALLVLVASIAHRLSGANRVYGVYTPTYPSLYSSPLLNANNESGLLNLGAFCGLGLFLSSGRRRTAGGAALLGAAALVAGSILTSSRGGTLTLLVGFTATAAVLVARGLRRGKLHLHRLGAFLGALLVGSLFFAVAVDRSGVGELMDQSTNKVHLFRWAWSVAQQHPWTGAGRGAVGSEIGRIKDTPSRSVFESAENWPLDFLGGWGFIVGAIAIAFVLLALNPKRLLRGTSSLHVACYVGVVALVVHNWVDLGFEIPGVALPLVVILGSLWGGRYGPKLQPASTERWSFPLLGTLLLIGSGLMLAFPQTKAREERRVLANLERGKKLTLTAVKDALGRHPGDAYMLRLGAVAAYRSRSQSALKWLNRSLLRDANNGSTYLLLAQMVHDLGGTQHAITALRKAVSTDPLLSKEAAKLALSISPSDSISAVPAGKRGAPMLRELARRSSSLTQKLELVQSAVERDPTAAESHLETANVWLTAAALNDTRCQSRRPSCVQEATAAVQRAEGLGLASIHSLPLRGRILAASGHQREGYELLLNGCPRRLKHRSCLATLLGLASSQSDEDFRLGAEAYLDGMCGRASNCKAAQNRAAGLFERRKDYAAALRLRRALAHREGTAHSWLRVSLIAKKLGLVNESERARRRAKQSLRPDEDALRRKLEGLSSE